MSDNTQENETGTRGMELHGESPEPLAPLVGAETLVVDPPDQVVPRLLERIEAVASSSPVRVVLSPTVADSLSEAFLLESRVAGAIARDELRVRETEDRCADRLVLADDAAGALVSTDERVSVLPLRDGTMLEELRGTYEPVWSDADEFSTRAPPRTELFEAEASPLPEGFVAEFRRAVEGASSLEWHGSPTPVELALAVAARTDAQHYDLCSWAEETGFTSRSTVARTKQQLEEAGLLAVEPVPQERGRPRQRLRVDEALLVETDPEELVPTLRELSA